MSFRIGHGYDVHAFGGEGALHLGGAVINESEGLRGHSDADVLLHAVLDALLGALALGDIGQWFPDTDPDLKDVSSVWLAEQVRQSPHVSNYEIVNLDTTVVAQRPRLASHIPRIRASTAAAMGTCYDRVSVKATTTEKMGFTGRGEGIAAYCVILLQQRQALT